MSERNTSADSFSEFFAPSKPENVNDENQWKKTDTPSKSVVATLIKSQPVLHRRTPLGAKATINKKKMPLTTNVKNSPPPLTYESDFDTIPSADEKRKHASFLRLKPRIPRISRRGSDSKVTPRSRERFLPSIRSKNRTKRLKKDPISEAKQRVVSAQHEKLNQLQSHLAELSRQLEDERIENKTLRSIQKREEKAIRKYEDQEYDIHQLARDYTYQIANVKEKILSERENKIKLEKELEDRDGELRDQTKKMKFYEKLVVQEADLDDADELREKSKETDRRLRKCQDKIVSKEKEIEHLESNYRQEIHQELLKQRELKTQLQNHAKKYMDLQSRLEEKSRQLGVMHIYLQRGGRRPSNSSSFNLSRARSIHSLDDTSPRFREKVLEYDKKRRDQDKLKPKPRQNPVPLEPPPKPKRKKYVPSVDVKPKPKVTKPPPPSPPPLLPPYIPVEKHASIIADDKVSSWRKVDDPFANLLDQFPPKDKPIIRRLSAPKSQPAARRLPSPKSVDESKSDTEDEPMTTAKTSPRSESYVPQSPVRKRILTPVSPPPEPLPARETAPTTTLFKSITRPESEDKWTDIFDMKTKDDPPPKSISEEKDERKLVVKKKPSPPSTQHSSMITFEPSSIATNGNQKKTSSRIPTTSIYDFDQTVVNLHDGKPATAQPPATTPTTTTRKTSIEPFENLFEKNKTTKPTHQMDDRDDTFTTTLNPFDSVLTRSTAPSDASTAIKPTVRQVPTPNDKLQRPKIVNNAPRPVANRTVVEDIEEFVL